MENEIRHILIDYKARVIGLEDACQEILSLMGESELGVLDAQQPSHGDLLESCAAARYY